MQTRISKPHFSKALIQAYIDNRLESSQKDQVENWIANIKEANSYFEQVIAQKAQWVKLIPNPSISSQAKQSLNYELSQITADLITPIKPHPLKRFWDLLNKPIL